MYSTVAELQSEGYDIRTIDVRHNMPTAQQYKIRGVPTFVYVVDGEEVRRITGPTSKQALIRLWRRGFAWL
jgi:predicted DsbA family dithiol-disulfide isomerase